MTVMDWLRTRLDIIDLIVLTIILLTTVYYSWRLWVGKTTGKFTSTVLPSYISSESSFDRQTSFVARMKSEERKVANCYFLFSFVIRFTFYETISFFSMSKEYLEVFKAVL